MLTGPTAEAGGAASAWPEATALEAYGSPLNKREGVDLRETAPRGT